MAEQRIVHAFEIFDFEDGTFGVLLEDYVTDSNDFCSIATFASEREALVFIA